MRKHTLAVALSVAATLVACGDADGRRTASVRAEAGSPPTWAAPGDRPCAQLPATPPAATTVGGYQVTELLTLSHTAPVSSVQAWGHYLAYEVGDEQVVVCDVDTGLVATVAEAGGDPTIVLTASTGSEDTLLLMRHSKPADPTLIGREWATWSLEALDLRTGTHWPLDRSSDDKDAADTKRGLHPSPAIEWPWVVWQHPVDEDEAELWSFDLRTDEAAVVATLPNGGLFDLAEGRVVYDHRVGDDRRDLYVVPADGSRKPERLTEMQGQWPKAFGDLVVWHDQVAPATVKPDPPSDPTVPPFTPAQSESWAYSLAERGEPRRLGAGSGPRPGNGFVLVTRDGALVLYDPDRPAVAPVELIGRERLEGVSSSAFVWRDYVAFTEWDSRADRRTLRLLRITRGGQ